MLSTLTAASLLALLVAGCGGALGLSGCVLLGLREDCNSPEDDDGDGRVNCEDADCADDPVCVEDCHTPEDDDGDGLTNCQDDDCWWSGACAVGSRVRRGARATWLKGWWWEGGGGHGTATSIDGTLDVRGWYPSMDTAPGAACHFHVDRVTFHTGWEDRPPRSDGFTATAARDGFSLSPDCPLGWGSFYLPVPIPWEGIVGGWGATVGGDSDAVPWYVGDAVLLSETATRTGSMYDWHGHASWSMVSFREGETFRMRIRP